MPAFLTPVLQRLILSLRGSAMLRPCRRVKNENRRLGKAAGRPGKIFAGEAGTHAGTPAGKQLPAARTDARSHERANRLGLIAQTLLVTILAQTLLALVLVDFGFAAFLEGTHGKNGAGGGWAPITDFGRRGTGNLAFPPVGATDFHPDSALRPLGTSEISAIHWPGAPVPRSE
jgi:hypothetical protein